MWSYYSPVSDDICHQILQVSYLWGSLVGEMVKKPPAMQETQVWSLGWEDPLEKGMVTHSNILAWRTPWAEEPGGLQSIRRQRVRHNWGTNTHKLFISWIQLLSCVWCLRPRELQHTRLPCPSPTPRACSSSCPLSRWCHPTISSAVIHFSSCLQSFQASGSSPMSQFFTSGGQQAIYKGDHIDYHPDTSWKWKVAIN